MPTNVRLPDGSVITVQTDDPQAAAKAARQHLAYQAASKKAQKVDPHIYAPGMSVLLGDLREQMGSDPSANAADRSLFGGMTLGLNRIASAVSAAAGAALSKANGKGTYSPGEAFNATRRALKDLDDQWAADHPKQALGTSIGGGLLMPGGTALGNWVMKGGLLANTGKGALAGGLLGAVQGGASAEPGKEAEGAKSGAAVGATVGTIAPGAMKATGSAVNGVVRAANKATGGRMLNPRNTAASRLREALAKDGLNESQIRAAMNEWLRVGGPSPTLLDLVGENTKSLLRGAAMRGGGRQAAQRYGDRVAADLQDNAIARTRQLTPEKRPVQQVREDLKDNRAQQANADFAEPYAQRINITPKIASALQGPEGDRAINMAIAGERANRNFPAVGDLERLRSAAALDGLPAQNRVNQYSTLATSEPPLQPTTGRALDRTQMMLGRLGEENYALGDGRAPYVGRGYFDRQKDLNDALDAFEHLQPARDAYRNTSQQIEGLDIGGRGLTMMPDEFAGQLAAAPGARQTAPLGYARALEESIGRPAEGATGALNRIASATNQKRNLGEAFGPEEAASYQQAIQQMMDQINNARFINPNTGSQTAGRLFDEGMVENIPTSKTGVLSAILSKLRQGVTLTDAERQAIVEIGTSSRLPDQSRTAQVAQQVVGRLPMAAAGGTAAAMASTPAVGIEFDQGDYAGQQLYQGPDGSYFIGEMAQ